MSHTPKRKHLCVHCKDPHINASFVCLTCGNRVCIRCVYVTIIHGKWRFYCKPSCAPYRVDLVEETYKHKEAC
jgi:hypothetical protein